MLRELRNMLSDQCCPYCNRAGERGLRVFNVHPTGRLTLRGLPEHECRTCDVHLVVDPELRAAADEGEHIGTCFTANPRYFEATPSEIASIRTGERAIQALEMQALQLSQLQDMQRQERRRR